MLNVAIPTRIKPVVISPDDGQVSFKKLPIPDGFQKPFDDSIDCLPIGRVYSDDDNTGIGTDGETSAVGEVTVIQRQKKPLCSDSQLNDFFV